MFTRADRLLLRVPNVPAAGRYWAEVLGAEVIASSNLSVTVRLPDDDFEIVLHGDSTLPEQAFYLLVPSVQEAYACREKLRLQFRTPPTRGQRGWHATVRDPFGVMLLIADVDETKPTDDAPIPQATDLFGAVVPARHKTDGERLARLYVELGRTADDLPYTPQFESLVESYTTGFADPKPTHAEVWRHLLTLRKAGKLPRLGAATSRPPPIDEADRSRLLDLLGTSIGRRDRLPYTSEFESIATRFNAGRRKPFSPHQVWRIVATLAK